MTPELQSAVDDLTRFKREFAQMKLSPVGYKDLREPALGRAVVAMAKELGVTLQQPIYVDSLGEMSIVALKPAPADPRYDGCAEFGEAFAKALTEHQARTGVQPTTISACNGWCRLFHMQAEKMVLAYAAAQQAA